MKHKSVFSRLITISLHEISARELADEFEVPPTTIIRWGKGSAKPAKLIQKLVCEYLLKRATPQA